MRSSSSRRSLGNSMSALSISSISSTGRTGDGERLPELAVPDVVADVGNAGVAELGIPQARDRVVFVEALLRPRRRFDVPGEQRRPERGGDLLRQQGLARPRLPLDQQWTLQRQGCVDRDPQILRRDICARSGKTHIPSYLPKALLAISPASMWRRSTPGASGATLRSKNDESRDGHRLSQGEKAGLAGSPWPMLVLRYCLSALYCDISTTG